MMSLPHPENKLRRYIQELDACAAALGADLTKADALLSELETEFHSMQIQQVNAMKKELMPSCRQMEQILRTMAECARAAQQAYERIDDDIASAFRG